MHSYLIIGNDQDEIDKKINSLSKSLQTKVIPFEVKKISDVRELEKVSNLSVDGKTAFLINNLDETSLDSHHAFLKSIEEPQENIYIFLTAKSTQSILPTILSRCQIIHLRKKKSSKEDSKRAISFIRMSQVEKVSHLSKIKTRDEALQFIEKHLESLHNLLVTTPGKHIIVTNYIDSFLRVKENIEASGNVQLHLTNMVLSLVS